MESALQDGAPAAVAAFYANRAYAPYWTGAFGVQDKKIEPVLAKFENARTHALNPDRYHVTEIKALREAATAEDKARLEFLMTDGYLRYVQDISGMRVDAAKLGLAAEHWVQPVPAPEALSWLDRNGAQLERKLQALEPAGQVYNRFRHEYMRLSHEISAAGGTPAPIEFTSLLKPGKAHETVPDIRARMGLEQPEQGKNIYDDNLAAAVMAFQKDNDLTPDGVIGPETVARMNKGPEDKLRQIAVNMERMRWMPKHMGDKYVVVNIPSAMLWAVEGGKVALEMPVIVGKPERPTPIFRSEITGMRFNPDWTIPPTIKRKDILPKIREDAGFLYSRNIALSTVRDGKRVTIDPASIDWSTISSRELHQIDMVQIPGENNPLGQYRVLMPNIHNVYLHDTSNPEMFDKPGRAFSSGCMRMKEPGKMAEFILHTQPGWNAERINKSVASQRRTDVPIEARIPVYTVYYSAWLDKTGEIIYGSDIYGRDAALYEALAADDALPNVFKTASSEAVDAAQLSLAQP